MRKGFSALFLIVMVFFLAAPLVFYFTVSKGDSQIKGASSSEPSIGFSVNVNSSQGTWDLYEYGCSDIDECRESLFSGKKLTIISGGEVNSHKIDFTGKNASQDVKYIKLFIKPGWGATQRDFTVTSGSFSGMTLKEFDDDGVTVKALLIPVTAFEADYFSAGSFSD
jgi:hypothetical protein